VFGTAAAAANLHRLFVKLPSAHPATAPGPWARGLVAVARLLPSKQNYAIPQQSACSCSILNGWPWSRSA